MNYTYVFHNPANGLTKIGRSSAPSQRFEQLSRELIEGELVPLCVFNDDREMAMHRQFAEFRVMGEWFQFPDDVRKSFGQIHKNDLPRGGAQRITITLPSPMVRMIDAEARKAKRNRANYMAHQLDGLFRQSLTATTTNTSEQ